MSSKSLFWRIDTPLPWNNARAACRASMGDLEIPKSGTHRAIVTSLISMKVYQDVHTWIGIQRQNGVLKFIDGSDIPANRWPTYTNNYAICINNQDCGFVVLTWWDNQSGSMARVDSYVLGFYYCTQYDCNTAFIFICQVHQSNGKVCGLYYTILLAVKFLNFVCFVFVM